MKMNRTFFFSRTPLFTDLEVEWLREAILSTVKIGTLNIINDLICNQTVMGMGRENKS